GHGGVVVGRGALTGEAGRQVLLERGDSAAAGQPHRGGGKVAGRACELGACPGEGEGHGSRVVLPVGGPQGAVPNLHDPAGVRPSHTRARSQAPRAHSRPRTLPVTSRAALACARRTTPRRVRRRTPARSTRSVSRRPGRGSG